MKKLIDNQNGAGHMLLILVFVVALAGIVGFAYTRISDKQNKSVATESSQVDEEISSPDDDESEIDKDSQEDPSDNLEDGGPNEE